MSGWARSGESVPLPPTRAVTARARTLPWVIGDFAALTRRQQVRRLRAAAVDAAHRFDLRVTATRLVAHDFNTTFRLETTTGRRYAVRLNTNSIHDAAAVRDEVAWVAELADRSDVLVPRPAITASGDHVVEVEVEGIGRAVPVVAFDWLEGRDLGATATSADLDAIGSVAARLHEHGAARPAPTSRATFDTFLMDSPDHLAGLDADWYPDDIRAVVEAARARVEDLLAPVFAADRHIIHGDLHPWNARRTASGIAVFDFEDCGIGPPLLDVAVAAYYVRDRPRHEEALLAAYDRERGLPPHAPEQFEALLAGRNLLLFNDLAATVTAGHGELQPVYARRTAERLGHWLDTGTFRFTPGP